MKILFIIFAYALDEVTSVSDGGTNYSFSAQALAELHDEVLVAMGYVVGLLYAIASIVSLYNALTIYSKVQTGEEGMTKPILMLVGAVMYLIGATLVLPAFFGIEDFSLR